MTHGAAVSIGTISPQIAHGYLEDTPYAPIHQADPSRHPDCSDYPDFDRHEHPAIQIIGYDGVSDQGQEIYNFLEQEGRKNVVLMGVHTNMCVLGRPFGIRQQKYLGKNVVLCRDLTDGLYDPRDPPHVSHARGVELIIEHIEKYWCPSILGESLTRVVPGSAGPENPLG